MLCRRQWCVTIRGFPTSGRQAHSRLVGQLKALFLMVAPDCKSQWFGRTGRERDDLLYDDQTTNWQRRLALMVPLPLIANHRKVERERRRAKERGREGERERNRRSSCVLKPDETRTSKTPASCLRSICLPQLNNEVRRYSLLPTSFLLVWPLE